jgi:hypothetical protein
MTSTVDTVETLTGVEATVLDDLEQTIEKGLATFVEVGRALEAIRDRRLYRETHSTFESYCKERWGISRGHAYRQIDGAQVVSVLQDSGTGPKMSTRLGDVRLQVGDIPASESVARELVPLKDEPEQVQQAWRQTVEEHGSKPTAGQVREVVKRKTSTDAKRKKAPARAPRKPTKRHMEEVGQKRADEITRALFTIKDCRMPGLVFGWALDAMERDPSWSWEKFIEDIEAAEQSLCKLTENAQERDERSWPEQPEGGENAEHDPAEPSVGDLPEGWSLEDLEAIAAEDVDS